MTTHRTAKVCVKNETARTFSSVHVVHKYSDTYKNKEDWGSLSAGDSTSPPLQVDYTTGFLTTGYDWWVVTWQYQDDNKVYFTNPQNSRDIVDFLEKSGAVVVKAVAAGAGAVIGTVTTAGLGTIFGLAGGVAVGANIAEMVFNSEITDGFKGHNLKDDDDGKLITIVIRDDNYVEFKATSSTSTTGSSYTLV